MFEPSSQRLLQGESEEERKRREMARKLGYLGAGLSGIPGFGPALQAGTQFLGDTLEEPYDRARMRKAALMDAARQLMGNVRSR